MNREIILTADGSASIQIASQNVTYHSRHGALTESMHVFIEAGYLYWQQQVKQKNDCAVFEMGFGTGLNALLTLTEAEKFQCRTKYTAVELFPLEKEITGRLNYPDPTNALDKLHACDWEKEIAITSFFSLKKVNTSLQDFTTGEKFDIIYYDAFAPNAQPELWTKEMFEKLYAMLHPGGLLVTYCSKGEVQRAMKAAGFAIEKLPGPPGKREMIRAQKAYSKV
jgi:Uncharacterized conserved protein